MSSFKHNDCDATGDAPSRARSRPLIGFLTVSAALHAAAIVVLPGLVPDRVAPPVTVLEVALVQAEMPRLIPEATAPEPVAQPRQLPRRVANTSPRREPGRQMDAPAPVLAMPEPRASAEPSFAVPAPRPAEPPAAAAETRTEVANLAVIPPSFGAAYLRNPAPSYPVTARRNNVQGTVTLRVLVTREGWPARVDLERSSGSSQLDQAALDTVKTWRFAPARRGNEPIDDTVIVPIVFRLERAS